MNLKILKPPDWMEGAACSSTLFVKTEEKWETVVSRVSEHLNFKRNPSDVWALFIYSRSKKKMQWECPLCPESDSLHFGRTKSTLSLKLRVLRHLKSHHKGIQETLEVHLQNEWSLLEREFGASLVNRFRKLPKCVKRMEKHRSAANFVTLLDDADLVNVFGSETVCEICCEGVEGLEHVQRHTQLQSKLGFSEFFSCEESSVNEYPWPHPLLAFVHTRSGKHPSTSTSLSMYEWRCRVPSCLTCEPHSFPTIVTLKMYALRHFEMNHEGLFNADFLGNEWSLVHAEAGLTNFDLRRHKQDVDDEEFPSDFILPVSGDLIPFEYLGQRICGFCYWTTSDQKALKRHLSKHGYDDTEREPFLPPTSLNRGVSAHHRLQLNALESLKPFRYWSGNKQLFNDLKQLWEEKKVGSITDPCRGGEKVEEEEGEKKPTKKRVETTEKNSEEKSEVMDRQGVEPVAPLNDTVSLWEVVEKLKKKNKRKKAEEENNEIAGTPSTSLVVVSVPENATVSGESVKDAETEKRKSKKERKRERREAERQDKIATSSVPRSTSEDLDLVKSRTEELTLEPPGAEGKKQDKKEDDEGKINKEHPSEGFWSGLQSLRVRFEEESEDDDENKETAGDKIADRMPEEKRKKKKKQKKKKKKKKNIPNEEPAYQAESMEAEEVNAQPPVTDRAEEEKPEPAEAEPEPETIEIDEASSRTRDDSTRVVQDVDTVGGTGEITVVVENTTIQHVEIVSVENTVPEEEVKNVPGADATKTTVLEEVEPTVPQEKAKESDAVKTTVTHEVESVPKKATDSLQKTAAVETTVLQEVEPTVPQEEVESVSEGDVSETTVLQDAEPTVTQKEVNNVPEADVMETPVIEDVGTTVPQEELSSGATTAPSNTVREEDHSEAEPEVPLIDDEENNDVMQATPSSTAMETPPTLPTPSPETPARDYNEKESVSRRTRSSVVEPSPPTVGRRSSICVVKDVDSIPLSEGQVKALNELADLDSLDNVPVVAECYRLFKEAGILANSQECPKCGAKMEQHGASHRVKWCCPEDKTKLDARHGSILQRFWDKQRWYSIEMKLVLAAMLGCPGDDYQKYVGRPVREAQMKALEEFWPLSLPPFDVSLATNREYRLAVWKSMVHVSLVAEVKQADVDDVIIIDEEAEVASVDCTSPVTTPVQDEIVLDEDDDVIVVSDGNEQLEEANMDVPVQPVTPLAAADQSSASIQIFLDEDDVIVEPDTIMILDRPSPSESSHEVVVSSEYVSLVDKPESATCESVTPETAAVVPDDVLAISESVAATPDDVTVNSDTSDPVMVIPDAVLTTSESVSTTSKCDSGPVISVPIPGVSKRKKSAPSDSALQNPSTRAVVTTPWRVSKPWKRESMNVVVDEESGCDRIDEDADVVTGPDTTGDVFEFPEADSSRNDSVNSTLPVKSALPVRVTERRREKRRISWGEVSIAELDSPRFTPTSIEEECAICTAYGVKGSREYKTEKGKRAHVEEKHCQKRLICEECGDVFDNDNPKVFARHVAYAKHPKSTKIKVDDSRLQNIDSILKKCFPKSFGPYWDCALNVLVEPKQRPTTPAKSGEEELKSCLSPRVVTKANTARAAPVQPVDKVSSQRSTSLAPTGTMICLECHTEVAEREMAIVEHVNKHMQKSYECALCASNFPDVLVLAAHIREKHNVTTVIHSFINTIEKGSLADVQKKCFPMFGEISPSRVRLFSSDSEPDRITDNEHSPLFQMLLEPAMPTVTSTSPASIPITVDDETTVVSGEITVDDVTTIVPEENTVDHVATVVSDESTVDHPTTTSTRLPFNKTPAGRPNRQHRPPQPDFSTENTTTAQPVQITPVEVSESTHDILASSPGGDSVVRPDVNYSVAERMEMEFGILHPIRESTPVDDERVTRRRQPARLAKASSPTKAATTVKKSAPAVSASVISPRKKSLVHSSPSASAAVSSPRSLSGPSSASADQPGQRSHRSIPSASAAVSDGKSGRRSLSGASSASANPLNNIVSPSIVPDSDADNFVTTRAGRKRKVSNVYRTNNKNKLDEAKRKASLWSDGEGEEERDEIVEKEKSGEEEEREDMAEKEKIVEDVEREDVAEKEKVVETVEREGITKKEKTVEEVEREEMPEDNEVVPPVENEDSSNRRSLPLPNDHTELFEEEKRNYEQSFIDVVDDSSMDIHEDHEDEAQNDTIVIEEPASTADEVVLTGEKLATCQRIFEGFTWEGPEPAPCTESQAAILLSFEKKSSCPICTTSLNLRREASLRDREWSMLAHLIVRHAANEDVHDLLKRKRWRLSTMRETDREDRFTLVPPFQLEATGFLECSACLTKPPKKFSNLQKLKDHWEECAKMGGEKKQQKKPARPVPPESDIIMCPLEGCKDRWINRYKCSNTVTIVCHLLLEHTSVKDAFTRAVELGESEHMATTVPHLDVTQSFRESVSASGRRFLCCSVCGEMFMKLNHLIEHSQKKHATEVFEGNYTRLPLATCVCGRRLRKTLNYDIRFARAAHVIDVHYEDMDIVEAMRQEIDTAALAVESPYLDVEKSLEATAVFGSLHVVCAKGCYADGFPSMHVLAKHAMEEHLNSDDEVDREQAIEDGGLPLPQTWPYRNRRQRQKRRTPSKKMQKQLTARDEEEEGESGEERPEKRRRVGDRDTNSASPAPDRSFLSVATPPGSAVKTASQVRKTIDSWLQLCPSQTVLPALQSELVEVPDVRDVVTSKGLPPATSEIDLKQVLAGDMIIRSNVPRGVGRTLFEQAHPVQLSSMWGSGDRQPIDISHIPDVQGTRCPLCAFLGQTPMDTRVHYKREHVTIKEDQDGLRLSATQGDSSVRRETREQVVACAACNKPFQNMAKLQYHVATEHDAAIEKCFACHICSRVYKTLKNVEDHHHRVHEGKGRGGK